jgi:hypothetical protein
VNIEFTEATWLEDAGEISLAELARISGLEEARLRELVDYGALAPIDPAAASWTFSAECVVTARTACRLLNDFELEPHGLVVVLTLLERIRGLESELNRLRARMPRLR